MPKEKWPLTLPEAIRTMRMAPDSATFNSPFERVYGKPPINRIETTLNPLKQFETKELKPYPEPISQEKINTKITDNGESVEVEINNGSKRVLRKVGKFLAQNVFNINEEIPVQELLQIKKDFAVNHVRKSNKRNYEKDKKFYVPLKQELCDYYRPLDPESKFSRKLARYWSGPYSVKLVNDKTAEIQKVDAITFEPIEGVKKVHISTLRPTLVLSLLNCSKLNDKAVWEK